MGPILNCIWKSGNTYIDYNKSYIDFDSAEDTGKSDADSSSKPVLLFSYSNTKTYEIPSDGEYNFTIYLCYGNNDDNHSLSNKVSLKIGSETITVFHHYYEGSSWKVAGSTSKALTRQCTAGDTITLTTSKRDSGHNFYTAAALMIY